MNFGKVIVSFRKKWSMEQDDLGKAVGVSKAYISLIENDKRRPMHVIARIAEFFDVPLNYFILEASKTSLLKEGSAELKAAIHTTEPVLQELIKYLTPKGNAKSKEFLIPPKKKKKTKRKEVAK